MGAEVSTDVTFKHPIKSTSNQLEGNKLKVQINKLTANTKYYYRPYVNARDINYVGETYAFTTGDFDNLATTGDISNITLTSAKTIITLRQSNLLPEESLFVGIAYSSSEEELSSNNNFNTTEKSVSCMSSWLYFF